MNHALRPKRVLVIGATGQQGGASVRHLIARGWEVHALGRDRTKPAAEALERDGAILAQGDLDDTAALTEAMERAPAVFCVLSSYTDQGVTVTHPFLPADKSLQMIAVEDIGALAAIALDRRGDFVGRSIEIAGDELTMQQIADTFEHVAHVPAL